MPAPAHRASLGKKRAPRRNQSALECMDETASRANGCRNWRRFYSRGSRPADFADLKAHEPPDGNVLAELRDRLCDHFADRHALILDVMLLVQAVFLVELFHLSVHDFF